MIKYIARDIKLITGIPLLIFLIFYESSVLYFIYHYKLIDSISSMLLILCIVLVPLIIGVYAFGGLKNIKIDLDRNKLIITGCFGFTQTQFSLDVISRIDLFNGEEFTTDYGDTTYCEIHIFNIENKCILTYKNKEIDLPLNLLENTRIEIKKLIKKY